MAASPEKAVVREKDTFNATAPAGYIWKSEGNGTSVLAIPTLAWIEQNGVEGRAYTVGDKLLAVYAKNNSLWCKDLGNKSIAMSQPTSEDQPDYVRDLLGRTDEWDQSNWVELYFGEGNTPESLVGDYICANTVTGVLSDKLNYRLTLTGTPDDLRTEPGETYKPNEYMAANFYESYLILKDGDQGALSNANGRYYYFLNPKVQEYALITRLMWNGENFVMPEKGRDPETGQMFNGHNWEGCIGVNWDFNSADNVSENLSVDKTYEFHAIIRRKADSNYGPSHAPTPKSAGQVASGNIEICPTDFDLSDETIITGVRDVLTKSKEIVSVKYVNAAGLVSDRPFEGVNIVVTKYTDGSTTTVKQVR